MKLIETIESLVDTHPVADIVLALEEVCQDKATHLRSNWQDDLSAAVWERRSKILEAAYNKLD